MFLSIFRYAEGDCLHAITKMTRVVYRTQLLQVHFIVKSHSTLLGLSRIGEGFEFTLNFRVYMLRQVNVFDNTYPT